MDSSRPPHQIQPEKEVKLYSSWFCPFAQRAWIALEEKGVPYELIEVDPYKKSPEWLAVNPRGLVPAIQHKGKSIYESLIVLEYLDEVYRGVWPRLLPEDPYERAVARIWIDFVSKKVVPVFYRYLQRQENAEQDKARDEYLAAFAELSSAMESIHPSGPFFMGPEFGMVDIALAPWAVRNHVLEHYRGFRMLSTPEYTRFNRWLEAVRERPSVKATLAEDAALLDTYKRYADNTAQSLVANAVTANTTLP